MALRFMVIGIPVKKHDNEFIYVFAMEMFPWVHELPVIYFAVGLLTRVDDII
jgi:hypothetical protein